MIIQTIVEYVDGDLGFAGERYRAINSNSSFVEALLNGDTESMHVLSRHDGASGTGVYQSRTFPLAYSDVEDGTGT